MTIKEKEELEIQHSKEWDRRAADRIKAVLLNVEGWTQVQLAQALRILYETVRDHLNDYRNTKSLKPENGGSNSHLNSFQTTELISHFEATTYIMAEHIFPYIEQRFGVQYTLSGITKWLENNRFSYNKPKGTPAKADPIRQAEFIKYYENLLNTLPEGEPVEFADAVHPTIVRKEPMGGFRKGQDKLIATTAFRTRINLLGSINLETMEVTIAAHETIDSKVLEKHFVALHKKYPMAPKIYQIVDRGPYNISKETKLVAEKYGILLHHLPPYSPNLNPIEQL